jgi:hypothetical protein
MAKPRLFDKLDHFKRTPDIIRLYESGEKIEYIGAVVGLHPSNVRKIAQRYGAAVRKRGRPKRSANGERLSLLRRKIRNAPPSKGLSCLLHETLLGPGNRQLVAHPRGTIL